MFRAQFNLKLLCVMCVPYVTWEPAVWNGSLEDWRGGWPGSLCVYMIVWVWPAHAPANSQSQAALNRHPHSYWIPDDSSHPYNTAAQHQHESVHSTRQGKDTFNKLISSESKNGVNIIKSNAAHLFLAVLALTYDSSNFHSWKHQEH